MSPRSFFISVLNYFASYLRKRNRSSEVNIDLEGIIHYSSSVAGDCFAVCSHRPRPQIGLRCMKNSFDTVDHGILIEKLYRYSIRSLANKLICG